MNLHAAVSSPGRPRAALLLALAALAQFVSFVPWAAPGVAQAPPGTELRVVDVDDSGFPTIRIVLEVEAGGRPATTLEPESLLVRETGSAATVTSVQRAVDASIPLALVVALDVSGSMAGATIARAQEAAVLLLESLAPADSAALVSFAQGARIERPMGTPIAEIVAAVNALEAEGNTALYDAVVLSAGTAGPVPGARRAVVLLSDGEDFGGISTATREASLAAAAASGAVFYVIGVGTEVDAPYLEELARRTGGRYFGAPGAAEIGGIYQSLSELLRSQFVVTIESTADPAPRERELVVSIVDDSVVTATVTYQSRQPLPTPTPLPVTPTATPTPPPPTPTPTPVPPAGATADEGGGGGAGVVAGILVALLALGGGGAAALLIRRRSRREPAPVQTAGAAIALPAGNGARPAAKALLLFDDTRYEITEETGPFVAGTSSECLVRLPEHPSVRPLHVRLWWRDGRLMLHNLVPGVPALVNGSPVEWVSLSDGDELMIGPHILRYQAVAPGRLSQDL